MSNSKWHLLLFSVAANLLLLAMPIYLVQLYDRVLPSANLNTLFYLSGFILLCLALHGVFEAIRNRIAHNMGTHYELSSAPAILRSATDCRLTENDDLKRRMDDLVLVRHAMASRSFIGLFDLPFTPLFLALLFIIHPLIGAIGLFGVLFLVALTITNEYLVHGRMRSVSKEQSDLETLRQEYFGAGKYVRAMNIAKPLINRWLNTALDIASTNRDVNRINANYFGFLRFFRQATQLSILGGGTLLVIDGNLSAGLIFAASIIGGKALMPIEQLVGSWRQLAAAWNAHKRVEAFQQRTRKAQDLRQNTTSLPRPTGHISCEGLTIVNTGAKDTKNLLLTDISFKAIPGEVIALIGSSGAGKTTLLEALAGLQPPSRGKIRFDDFSLDQWQPEVLGKHIGYLSQTHNFLSGSISQNIARFSNLAINIATSNAANLAGMHGLIGTLENGYQQQIDSQGNPLSAGQKQWIKLSRAFFGDPQILLLDEPDTGLDQVGEVMLRKTIARARERGKTVIFSTQRAHLATSADTVLLLDRGRIIKHGESRDVLKPDARSRQMPAPSEQSAS